MLRPQKGLLAFVRKTRNLASRDKTSPPSLTEASKDTFFDYWDEDASGALDKEEVVRALVKTFNLSENGQGYDAIRDMREIVDNVWCIFDHDGGGDIDREEFIARNGLADAIIGAKAYAQK